MSEEKFDPSQHRLYWEPHQSTYLNMQKFLDDIRAAFTAEIEGWKASHENALRAHDKTVGEIKVDNARLYAALEKYGHHLAGCNGSLEAGRLGPCNCGFESVKCANAYGQVFGPSPLFKILPMIQAEAKEKVELEFAIEKFLADVDIDEEDKANMDNYYGIYDQAEAEVRGLG